MKHFTGEPRAAPPPSYRARRRDVSHECPACAELRDRIGKLKALAADPAATSGERLAALAGAKRLEDRLAIDAIIRRSRTWGAT